MFLSISHLCLIVVKYLQPDVGDDNRLWQLVPLVSPLSAAAAARPAGLVAATVLRSQTHVVGRDDEAVLVVHLVVEAVEGVLLHRVGRTAPVRATHDVADVGGGGGSNGSR